MAKSSTGDVEQLDEYSARLSRIAALLRQWVLRAPPNLGGPFVVRSGRDLAAAARLMWQFGRLPATGQRDLIDLITKSAGHWLDSIFESEPLKTVLALDAVVGNYASPLSSGTAYGLLHNSFGEVNGKPGRWGHAIGGMGRITE